LSEHVERGLMAVEQTKVIIPPESLQGAPPDYVRSVAEQYKQEIKQDNQLAKSHHEFEAAQGASDIARDNLVKHLSKATGGSVSPDDVPVLKETKPELFENLKVKGALETYEKAEVRAEQSRAEFAQSFDTFRAQHAKEPSEHVISQHETERYLSKDWDSARLAIESKLTQYHGLPDKSSDEAMRMERAVLDDIGRVDGKVKPEIMDEEGARLLIERGDFLISNTKFGEYAKEHREDFKRELSTMSAFIKKQSREIYDLEKFKNLGLVNLAKLVESRDNFFKRVPGQ